MSRHHPDPFFDVQQGLYPYLYRQYRASLSQGLRIGHFCAPPPRRSINVLCRLTRLLPLSLPLSPSLSLFSSIVSSAVFRWILATSPRLPTSQSHLRHLYHNPQSYASLGYVAGQTHRHLQCHATRKQRLTPEQVCSSAESIGHSVWSSYTDPCRRLYRSHWLCPPTSSTYRPISACAALSVRDA